MSTPEQAIRSLLRSAYLSNGQISSEELMDLLNMLGSQLDFEGNPAETSEGLSENYMDSLPRINKDKISEDESCAICQCNFLDDPYPLVVRLPRCQHQFDLECLTMWLHKNHTCPMCRDDLCRKKLDIDISQCELEPDFNMYG